MYEPLAGTGIKAACAEAYQELIRTEDRSITFKFNAKTVTVRATDVNGSMAAAMFLAAIREQSKEYAKSPEGIAAAERSREQARQITAAEDERRNLAATPITIKPGLWQEYADYVHLNSSDAYSFGIVRYAEKWAELMEACVESWPFDEMAEKTARAADTEGITGYMYGAAVASLSKFWVRGEELRRWHNAKQQIGTEGDRASEEGGTLNPALLAIG